MSAIDLKKWKRSSEGFTSPALPPPLFKEQKGVLIREKIFAEFDDKRRMIKILINDKAAKGNEEKLERLGWIKG